MSHKKPEGVKVRVLVTCAVGECDEVLTLDKKTADELSKQGVVDQHPDAVAYAESIT